MELAARLLTPDAGPSETARRAELRGHVRAALEQLAAGDREVLVLRHLEQLSVKEIAAVLRVSEGAVKTRTLRALRRLRAALGDNHSGGR
jgi:RNA polymerase sigma factor (sigma-70 family)